MDYSPIWNKLYNYFNNMFDVEQNKTETETAIETEKGSEENVLN